MLPLGVLYTFTSPFNFFLFKICKYRSITIKNNLKNSFPELPGHQLNNIEKAFKGHFSKLIFEGIKNLDFSKKQLTNRFHFENLEELEEIYFQNQSVVLLSSHVENWEWLITSLGIHLKHRVFGIGMPLTNSFFNKKLNAKRERFGLKVIHAKNYKEELTQCKSPFAVLVLADQSPPNTENAYWTTFLHQNSGFFFGPEYLANTYNAAVMYLHVKEVKKGYYSCSIESIEKSPKQQEFGEITKKYVQKLENQIQQNPAKWLWSHKRWKRTPPTNLEGLIQKQKTRFTKKFR